LQYVRCVIYGISHMTYDTNDNRRRKDRQPKKNGLRIPISSYLEESDFTALRALAEINERPVAAEIRLAVRKHLGLAA